MMKVNEAKCCDAAMKYLESTRNGTRHQIEFPECDASTSPDARIEVLFKIGALQFAMEHTLIEPFSNHRRGSVLTRELETMLREKIGKSNYDFMDLLLPHDWHANFTTRKLRQKFSQSIVYFLQNLTVMEYKLLTNPDETWRLLGEISGMKIHVQFRTEDFDLGGLTLALLSNHTQSDRIERVGRAINTKIPKLKRYGVNNIQTVLIIENSDLQLTNWNSVERAVKESWNEYPKGIDNLFYISACHSTWYLHPLVENGKINSLKVDGRTNFVKFLESELSNELPLRFPHTPNHSTTRGFS
jgi:hypothetical protein